MTEYEKIREARIALLCVGDTIHRIHRFIGNFDDTTHEHTIHYMITTEYIDSIGKKDFKIVISPGYLSTQFLRCIELYNDELYIWGTPEIFSEKDHNKKARMLAEIIKSDETKYNGEYH
jgi:hypothetical protein